MHSFVPGQWRCSSGTINKWHIIRVQIKSSLCCSFFPSPPPLQLIALFALLISHQPAVLFSHNKPAISNQPTVLFSQNKSAPAISHQPNEQAANP
jgi:hypothetical protein